MIESVGAVIVMLSAADAVFAGDSESVTVTVKLMVPTSVPVGVPLIAPVDAFRERPAGRLPVVTAHDVYGVIPPVAAKVAPLYAVPITPAGKLVVVTASFGLIVIVNCLLAVCAVGVSLSVTVTVKVALVPVGVPVIAPVEALIARPAGKLPVVTAHE